MNVKEILGQGLFHNKTVSFGKCLIKHLFTSDIECSNTDKCLQNFNIRKYVFVILIRMPSFASFNLLRCSCIKYIPLTN